ncbi:MAG: hypothetical protein JW395_3374 [Nitrospira sp.]|nr:hypothetical protein [Nitrospira sp.]
MLSDYFEVPDVLSVLWEQDRFSVLMKVSDSEGTRMLAGVTLSPSQAKLVAQYILEKLDE